MSTDCQGEEKPVPTGAGQPGKARYTPLRVFWVRTRACLHLLPVTSAQRPCENRRRFACMPGQLTGATLLRTSNSVRSSLGNVNNRPTLAPTPASTFHHRPRRNWSNIQNVAG